MVCIAAFIILAIIGVFVAVVSIFKPQVGKNYLKALKKAWGCLWKKVRLQKCETGFKDDVKNTLLSRVIVKHPTWVKPLSVVIEVVSVVIVVVAVWAIVVAVKSLLALWALGTCNVTQPAACSFGAEVCSIDEEEPEGFWGGIGRWFTEWGEIFEAIPDKFRSYDASDYDFNYIAVPAGWGASSSEEAPDDASGDEETSGGSEGSAEQSSENTEVEKPIAVDIFDPGCVVCLRSYVNQKTAGFFSDYEVRLVPYAIQTPEGEYKFKNSEVIVKYMFAAEQLHSGMAVEILDRVFTWKDDAGISYQNRFNNDYSREEAVAVIEGWLKDLGLRSSAVKEVREIAGYPEIADKMTENRTLVEEDLKAKGIPTMIYDGGKHTGLWKE